MITEEWLLDRVVVCMSGCWLWTGSDSGHGRGGGYPRAKIKGRTRAVHREVFRRLVAEIPRGYDVDHRCRVRLCVRPEHLEAVPGKVNQRRRWDAGALYRCECGSSDVRALKRSRVTDRRVFKCAPCGRRGRRSRFTGGEAR